jgi:hypothetical protein
MNYLTHTQVLAMTPAERIAREAELVAKNRAMKRRIRARHRATLCRHCHAACVNRPRGLCWSCYYAPGIRDLYPPTSKFARRGVGNGSKGRRLPATPTAAPPGSAEKLAVLEARAAAGEALFHPLDALGCRKSQADAPWPPGQPHRSRLAFVDTGDVLSVA